MPNYRRPHLNGGCYFFTVTAYQRQNIFTEELFRASLRHAITYVRKDKPFHINAWVLLPDHLHCIWTLPEDNGDFSARWSMIKRAVTKQLKNRSIAIPNTRSRGKRQESTLWQRRFWEHQIRDDRDLKNHMDYCYWNPVKHGLVNGVNDWPYSTFHRDVKNGIYPENWCGIPSHDDDKHNFGE